MTNTESDDTKVQTLRRRAVGVAVGLGIAAALGWLALATLRYIVLD